MLLKSNKTISKDIIEYNVALDMNNGNILASSDHNIKKKFTISTKHAVFEALGTSFIISSDNSTIKAFSTRWYRTCNIKDRQLIFFY